MRTYTHTGFIVDHDDREFDIPTPYGPVEEWFDPLVTLRDDGLHVSYIVHDDDSEHENPWADHEGISYTIFDNGHERNQWIDDFHDDPNADIAAAITEHRFFWLERYEHGLVRYAPTGESSAVDRQWDVASGVGWIMLDREWFGGVATPEQYLEVARSLCQEYTDWCNGSVYGVVHVRLDPTTGDVLDDDSCWGYLGTDHAEASIREEH